MSGRKTQPLSVMPMLSATRGTMSTTSRWWTRTTKRTTRTWTPSWAEAAQSSIPRKSGRCESFAAHASQSCVYNVDEWCRLGPWHPAKKHPTKLHRAAETADAGQMVCKRLPNQCLRSAGIQKQQGDDAQGCVPIWRQGD